MNDKKFTTNYYNFDKLDFNTLCHLLLISRSISLLGFLAYIVQLFVIAV